MMGRKFLYLFMGILLAFSLITAFIDPTNFAAASSDSSGIEKIEPALVDQFSLEGTSDFIVRFAEQTDLAPAYAMGWQERGQFVYNALKDTAARSQARAKGLLAKAGYEYQTFIAGNEVYVKLGNLDIATNLAALDEVAYIRATRIYELAPMDMDAPLTQVKWSGDLLLYNLRASVGSIDAAPTWGIIDTKADQFWSTFGMQGDGIIVANIDSGVQYDHPALDQAFACEADPTDPACWKDALGTCPGDVPCDDHGHGTHVMGTMVADDDETLPWIAGMAPNAQWIACKACNDDGRCTDLGLNTCADWMIAPADDPANRPNIVNNSWSYQGGNTWFQAKVDAWRAAGIFPSFVAGNFGSSCATIGSPGDYQESFASAAHDESRTIGWFSGRGPSDFGHDPYTKPNISAPGVSICSSIPTDTWSCNFSGTSQAAPHTAGAVALLWSCNHELIGDIDLTFQVLHATANSSPAGNCGVPPDGQGNYTYGYGYLDILAAGSAYCGVTEKGTIEGIIFDDHGNPVEGVNVSAFPSLPILQSAGIQSVSDPSGYYSLELLVGTYDLTAYKENYEIQTLEDIEVMPGKVTQAPPFILNFIPVWIEEGKSESCPDWTRFDGEYFEDTGYIYFLGGRASTETYPDIYTFDPATGTCADTGTDMPVGVSNYTIAPLKVGGQDVLCTFGGRDASGAFVNNVQCYDPLANSVSQPTTLPADFTGYIPGASVNLGNKAYVFGGFSLSAPYETAKTWEWDASTNTWSPLGDMFRGLSYLQCATVDDLIYCFGGSIYDETISDYPLVAQRTAQVLDPAAGTWTQLPDLLTPVAEGRAFGFDSGTEFELDGQVVVAGGGQFPFDTSEVFAYDVTLNTYDYTFNDLNVSRRDHAGVLVPGGLGESQMIWVFGGRSSQDGYGGDDPPFAPPETYEVELAVPYIFVNPSVLDKHVLVDTPRTVVLDIMNLGGGILNWSISQPITSSVDWLSVDPESGENYVPVDVNLDPPGLGLGEYTAELLIESDDILNPVVTVPVTMTVVIQEAGVELTPAVDAKTGDPGSIVKYALVIENTGNYIDTFDIEASGEWEASLSANSVELENGDTATINVNVYVPADALGGSDDVTTVSVTSQFDPKESAQSVLTTTANTVYLFELTPDAMASSGYPGDVVEYTLRLTNYGNTDDTITLSPTGNLWSVSLSSTKITLAPSAFEDIIVQVIVPVSATAGQVDVVTITATSESDLAVTSDLTTRSIYRTVTLPLIFKY